MIFKKILFCILVICLICACGKYAPPISPENFSADSVLNLEAKAKVDQVTFVWNSPKTDRRGKAITEITDFIIFRADASLPSKFSQLNQITYNPEQSQYNFKDENLEQKVYLYKIAANSQFGLGKISQLIKVDLNNKNDKQIEKIAINEELVLTLDSLNPEETE